MWFHCKRIFPTYSQNKTHILKFYTVTLFDSYLINILNSYTILKLNYVLLYNKGYSAQYISLINYHTPQQINKYLCKYSVAT